MDRIKVGKQTVFDTSIDVYEPLCSRESYGTACFNELIMFFVPKDESYRKYEEKINRIRWQDGEQTQDRAIANIIERKGD